MRFRSRRLGLTMLAVVCLAATAAAGAAENRKPAKILKDYDAVKMPEFDLSTHEEGYIQRFVKERREAETRRGELAMELYRVDPKNDRLPEMLRCRWGSTATLQKAVRQDIDDILGEIARVKAESKDVRIAAEGDYIRALFLLCFKGRARVDEALKAMDDFLAEAPKDERGAYLLFVAAQSTGIDPKRQAELYRRLARDFKNTYEGALAEGILRRADGIGKPFELTFEDAIRFQEISVQKDLKGKVVVVDFWAPWDNPSIEAMPAMKALYSKYHDKGVEFIGVCRDWSEARGGLGALKWFVELHGIKWPQYYYPGNSGHGDFSRSWGVLSIPCVFLVGPDGKLVSTDASEALEGKIKEQLKATTDAVK